MGRPGLSDGQRGHRGLALDSGVRTAASEALRHQGLEARVGVAAWIEDCNTTRRHSALGMLSPLAYEQALAAGQAA
jgi:hypothetical protein